MFNTLEIDPDTWAKAIEERLIIVRGHLAPWRVGRELYAGHVLNPNSSIQVMELMIGRSDTNAHPLVS